jgi:cytoskeletal protein RodZ
MQTLGDYLKKNREARNISLSDISDYTKISKTYLDWLEKDEYTKIPAEPYVKGYISSYVECVGIDENEALKLYDSCQTRIGDEEEIEPGILQDSKKSVFFFHRINRKIWFAIAFSILSIIGIGIYYSFFQNQKKAAADKSPEKQIKTVQPAAISATASDIHEKRQNGDFYQSGNQKNSEKKLENTAAKIDHDRGISQIPVPLEGQLPDQAVKDTVTDSPVTELSEAKDVPASTSNQTNIEKNFSVVEIKAGSSIRDRIPQGVGNSFEWSTDRIYIWTRIKCDNPPASIRHVYYFKGEKVNDILLNIRSSDWRTWSFKTLSNKRYIGPWRVDVTSADGNLLQSIYFEIK